MTSSGNDLPDAPRPSGRLIDARLHLLDRQLFDADDAPVGTVDDLDVDIPTDVDIAGSAPAPLVTGILTGQVLATRIFGGRPPRAKLQAVPWRLITKIGTVVQLSSDAEDFDSLWLEHWLRDHIIRRIPGGRRAAQ
jgi:sporulation protein YlmC with PRC-barrel domain